MYSIYYLYMYHRKTQLNLGKYMDVSENSGTPKSSILIGFSIIHHPFWGTPIFWKSHIPIPDSSWVVPVLHGQPGHSIPFPGQGDRSQHHPPQCGQKGKDTNILQQKKHNYAIWKGDFFAMNPEGLLKLLLILLYVY